MSRGLNKVMLIGNLGRDPEMRYTPSGKPVTSFSQVAPGYHIEPLGFTVTFTVSRDPIAVGS